MKEIDYIFKNIDVKKFLKLIKKKGEKNLTNEIYKSVKDPNKEIEDVLDVFVFGGVFFNKVKELSLTYYAWIESNNDRIDPNFKIICFYSNTDKKYRLISLDAGFGTGFGHYELVKTFYKKPTKQQIEAQYEDRMNELRKDNAEGLGVDIEDEDCKPVFFIMDGDSDNFNSLIDDDYDVYSKQLELERKKLLK